MVLTTRSVANCLALVLALFFLAACGGEDAGNETGPRPAGDVSDEDASDVQSGDACSGDLAAPDEGFVRNAAGTFTMGSLLSELGGNTNETRHEVTLTRDFWLQTTEVTQGDYQALMGSNPSGFTACGASCPVEQVSWYDAIAYANARSRAEGLPECYDGEGNVIGGNTVYECCGYRLPTEAEWEYAARAGTSTATYRGDLTGNPFSCDAQPNLDPIAWFCGNSGDGTRAVGTRSANAWGLYDTLGNVREWTSDWYDGYPGAVTDPVGPSAGSGRVVRGGSWLDNALDARAAARRNLDPGYRFRNVGFRLARTLP
jgi:formylglycine-generating enzyme required for sulfatase activity